jgi:hypothetical protein
MYSVLADKDAPEQKSTLFGMSCSWNKHLMKNWKIPANNVGVAG